MYFFSYKRRAEAIRLHFLYISKVTTKRASITLPYRTYFDIQKIRGLEIHEMDIENVAILCKY